MAKQRRNTTTSNFGVGARESHDSTPFYDRFRAPELSDDDTVLPPLPVAEPFVCGDSRQMDRIADGSVALVVTSPPYDDLRTYGGHSWNFHGIAYELTRVLKVVRQRRP